ncbi:uncharacterized protein UTRI_00450 [Ustilago trichophora]|uniref:Uncharacterized protein n=1 Tax=Ustilago trichophora TaxID=86804 RepID=A0A5C3DRB2_9BASI|nr:uncharacterized protein UTRI_00450 [Ustilago trichophora]
MTRRSSAAAQDETTPLLSYHNNDDGERRWSLSRRRSSAFLSFLSEPEDKEGQEYVNYQRKRAGYLIVFLATVYNVGIGIYHSFAVELIQTLACAEYYHSSSSPESPFPTLPSAGDPMDLCSVPWVDKRTSQISTYCDAFGSVMACIASLLLAKWLLPRVSRRKLAMASVSVTLSFGVLVAWLPTHSSFDPSIPSTSTLHPTTSLYLYVLLNTVGGLLGAPQTAMLLLSQATMLDVVREDEKTSGLSQVFASSTIGMAISSLLIRLVLPYFNLNFSILYHSGPFSPFWLSVIVWSFDLLLVYFLQPETRSFAQAKPRSRRSSISSNESFETITPPTQTHDAQASSPASSPPRSPIAATLYNIKETLGMFGYLLPYQSQPGAKRDYKLPLMLCAVIFSDNITMIWANLVIFCSTHLRFGPQQVTTLLGVLGATKGLFALFALPWIVQVVRRTVKRRMREVMITASIEDLTSEDRVAKREESAIYTDRLIAMSSLACDVLGFIAMGVAASHLSTAGIYGSLFLLMFAAGAVPSIQALSVDLFLAQDRPTDDPVAARDAFLGFLNLLATLLQTFGPLVNNSIYRWSIDHAVPALVFFWTSCSSFGALTFVASSSLFA